MRECVGVAVLTRPAESKACKTRKDVVAEASLLAWESELHAIGGMPATSQADCCALSGCWPEGQGLRTPVLPHEAGQGAGPVGVLGGG